MGITQETLKNGKVLRALVHQFLAEQNQQNLLAILKCLRDSYVWIPCNVNISEAATEHFLNAQVGDTVTSAEDIRFTPDILQNGDLFYFPVFSNCDQMGTDYGNHFSKIEKHFFEAMSLANARENVEGIVLDAFTQPFIVKKDLFDIIGKLPSSLEIDENE